MLDGAARKTRKHQKNEGQGKDGQHGHQRIAPHGQESRTIRGHLMRIHQESAHLRRKSDTDRLCEDCDTQGESGEARTGCSVPGFWGNITFPESIFELFLRRFFRTIVLLRLFGHVTASQTGQLGEVIADILEKDTHHHTDGPSAG